MNVNKAVLKFVKIGITVLLSLIIIYATINVGLIAFDFGYRIFTEPAMEADPGTDVVVIIDESMDGSDIGKELESKGLVRDALLFQLQLKLSAYDGKINPGTYILNTSMTAKDMMMAMSTEQLPENTTEDESKDTEKIETEDTEETEETTKTGE